jgi:hypothetical protein
MAKSKAKTTTKRAGKPAAKQAAEQPTEPVESSTPEGSVDEGSLRHGPPVDDGIETTRAYNESVRAAAQAAGNAPDAANDVAPGGVVTWPTEFGNPDMSIAPATPTKIVDGRAVAVTDVESASSAADDSEA